MEILFFLLIPLALVAFYFFDKWHQRYAWRKAGEEAAAFMRRRYPP